MAVAALGGSVGYGWEQHRELVRADRDKAALIATLTQVRAHAIQH